MNMELDMNTFNLQKCKGYRRYKDKVAIRTGPETQKPPCGGLKWLSRYESPNSLK